MHMSWSGFFVVAVMLAGCGAAGETDISQSAPAASSLPASATVSDVHAMLIIPASDTLFAAESNPPDSAAGWASLEAAALEVIDGARRLQSPSRKRDDTDWVRLANALEDGARKSLAAARAKDMDTLPLANGEFVVQCEDCHTTYRDGGIGMMNSPDL